MLLAITLWLCYNITKESGVMALKNRVRIGSAIDKDNYDNLKKLSDKTRIPISKLLDEAIEDLLKKHQYLANSSPT